MRCLVTGGYGFMGSWLVNHLTGSGHTVYILSRSAAGKLFIFDAGKEGSISFIHSDLGKEEAKDIAMKLPEIDVCIHTASLNDAGLSDYGKEALRVNILGTRDLLEAFIIKGQKLPVFIYASTFHVYGQHIGSIDENILPSPCNDYAVSHFCAEEYCRMYHRKMGFPTIVVRCTNGYGSPMCKPFGKWNLLFSDMCRQAFYTNTITLRSEPDIRRDFIWMGDIAAIMEKLMVKPELAGKTFNLGQGKSLSIGELASIVGSVAAKYLGKKISVSAQSPLDKKKNYLDISTQSLFDTINYSPGIHFEDEVIATLKFLSLYGDAP